MFDCVRNVRFVWIEYCSYFFADNVDGRSRRFVENKRNINQNSNDDSEF